MKKNINKKLVALAISAATIATTAMPAFAATYTDVKSSDWYYSTVTSLSDKNIISGYKDGSFKPNATQTFSQHLTDSGQIPLLQKQNHWV